MSHFIYRWHKCLILCIGGTNVAFLAIGGTNVVSYYRWHKCLGGSGTNFVVALFTVGKKSRHHFCILNDLVIDAKFAKLAKLATCCGECEFSKYFRNAG